MGKPNDFIVKYDPVNEPPELLTERIIYSLFVRPLKKNKPRIIFMGGDTGEGKTFSVNTFMKIILKTQGIIKDEKEFREYINVINIFQPLEYGIKTKTILFDKKYKKINTIALQEAREIVKAKRWQEFSSQAVADINAQARQIKRMCIFVVSQFIRDITTDVRYSLNYYLTVYRAMGGNGRAMVRIQRIWKDDRDLEKPKIRKRGIAGYVIYPNGRRRYIKPKYLELKNLEKQTAKILDELDTKAKKPIIEKKLEELMRRLQDEFGLKDDKIGAMVEFYTNNQESLKLIGKRTNAGKFKLNNNFKIMHDITPTEAKDFNDKLNQSLEKKQKDIFNEVQ